MECLLQQNGRTSSRSSNDAWTPTFLSGKLMNLPNLSLPALSLVEARKRTITLHRNVAGDFGFRFRRTQYLVGNGEIRTVVLAEPLEMKCGPPRPNDIVSGLLPGDQLLAINNVPIDKVGREELPSIIQSSGDSITLVVKTTPELAEFFDRSRSKSRSDEDSLLLPEVSSPSSQDIPEKDRYWLIHKNGYTLARLLEKTSTGSVKIAIGDAEMLVDVSDVDRANAIALDRAEDVTLLPYLNETSVLHVLRHRFGSSLLYTNVGPNNVICMAAEHQPTYYGRLITLFKGCRSSQMPPHIYATAQNVYRTMQMTGRDQCIVLTGVSGSGKSTQLQNICQYLCEVAGWLKSFPYTKIAASLGITEAFGNCAITSNENGSRFAQLYSLHFDTSAALRSAKIQVFLLESSRIARHPENESNFHVFYFLLEGAPPEMRKELNLDSITSCRFERDEDKKAAFQGWERLMAAFATLSITKEEIFTICSILAALLHLRHAEATQGSAQKAKFIRTNSANVAAALLGLCLEDLSAAVFRGNVPQLPIKNSINRFSMSNRSRNGQESLESFISCLYNALFASIVSLINRGLSSSNIGISSTISVVDIPGNNISSQWLDEDSEGRNLNDFIFNYLNDRILELFYGVTFTDSIDLYRKEHVEVDVDIPITNPSLVARLADQKPQLLNCTDIELRSAEKRGLLCILEEESLFPGATDDSFYERIFMHLDDNRLIRRCSRPREFIVNHGVGNNPVAYTVNGWVKAAQPGHSDGTILSLLQISKNQAISNLFSPFDMSDTESAQLRRVTQAIKMGAARMQFPAGFFANIFDQANYIVSFARRSGGIHFVHCLRPLTTVSLSNARKEFLDVPFVRSQLKSLLLVDAARMYTRGFPERMTFKTFRRRFECLVHSEGSLRDILDEKAAAARILGESKVFEHRYKLGLSLVLLRSNALAELEDRRDERLMALISSLQFACRRFLASKWLNNRRILETAIRCIQRNCNSYMKVRQWSWWKLYTRVTPLLAAFKKEDQEDNSRIRELEAQLQELRLTKERLENRVGQLEQMLTAECNSVHTLTESLSQEAAQRLRLEKQLITMKQSRRIDESGGKCEPPSSGSESSVVVASDKFVEMGKELKALREKEMASSSRLQKALEQMKDTENELRECKARNESLEQRNAGFDAEVETLKEQFETERKKNDAIVSEQRTVITSLTQKLEDSKALREENNELRSTASRLRKQIENASIGTADLNDSSSAIRINIRDLETKYNEQSKELDEIAGENQQLTQAVSRLEMAAERMRAERVRELSAKDGELEELKAQYQRRLRAAEEQLADLQDSNASLMTQNRILESRIRESANRTYSVASESGSYKRDLRKTLALYHDMQCLLAHEREKAPNHAVIRQLKCDLEDAEAARLSALKGRYSLESELTELRNQLEAALASKSAAEDKIMVLMKEKSCSASLIEEQNEQLQIAIKKYKAAVQQSNIDSITLRDQTEQIADMSKKIAKLTENLDSTRASLEYRELHSVEKHKLLLAEQRIRDIEAKLDVEMMQKTRVEALLAKANDDVENMRDQINEINVLREKDSEAGKKIRKELSVLHDQLQDSRKREAELLQRNKIKTEEVESVTATKVSLEAELKLCHKRIESLQTALNNEIDEPSSSDDGDDSCCLNDSVAGMSRL